MSLYLTMTQRNQWSDSLSDSTATRQSRHSPHLPHSLHGWYRWPMKDTFAGNPAGKPNPRTKVPDFPQLQHRQLQAGTFGHRLIFSQRQCFPTDACVIIPRGLRGVRRAHAGAKRGTLPRSIDVRRVAGYWYRDNRRAGGSRSCRLETPERHEPSSNVPTRVSSPTIIGWTWCPAWDRWSCWSGDHKDKMFAVD